VEGLPKLPVHREAVKFILQANRQELFGQLFLVLKNRAVALVVTTRRKPIQVHVYAPACGDERRIVAEICS
jgi:hypothetical protein